MKEWAEHQKQERVRNAVARELSRRINVDEDMIKAFDAFQQAQTDYRMALRNAADRVMDGDVGRNS